MQCAPILTYVCSCEVLPGYAVGLHTWPPRWQRFWFRVLFGWKWRAM